MRILHCPNNIGGHPCGLARAERALGMNSLSVALTQSFFGHASDELLWQKDSSLWRKEIARWKLLIRAFRGFDVIHYNFGSPILRWKFEPKKMSKIVRLFLLAYVKFCYLLEKQLLKNKVIAITYQGDDARQGDYSRSFFDYSIAQEVDDTYYSAQSDQNKRDLIQKFDQIADVIYAVNPDLLYVLPKRTKFLPYAHIDLNDWRPVAHPRSKIPIVLHAPSHSGAKGTRFILDAVSRLHREGIKFEFVLVENRQNNDARKLYEQCDLVIDQLLAGWYGGFAVEAMALGKPVICYIRKEDTDFIPVEMKHDLPFIQATPATIYDVLYESITLKVAELPVRGIISRAFIEKWHDPLQVAKRIISDYKKNLK